MTPRNRIVASKGSLHGTFPLPGVHSSQRWCRALAAQSGRQAFVTAAPGHGLSNRERLIEPAAPQPPAVERYGNENGFAGHPISKHRRNRSRKAGSPRIFQTQHNTARNISISDAGDHSIIGGRIGEAGCTGQSIVHAERDRTLRATAVIEKPELRPARGAEFVVVFNNARTARTARREHEIKHRFHECLDHSNVVGGTIRRHKREMRPPEIFDRNARRTQRGRIKGGGFFAETMIEDVLDRLDAVTREFADALIIGAEPGLIAALTAKGIHCVVVDPGRGGRIEDEDSLSVSPSAFDLVIAIGTLDTVADLPGALLLMRRALKPGGLLLAAFASAPSLTALRQAAATADATQGRAVQRLHPQIDVRAAGDLLVRAGFHMPVADMLTINVAYPNLARLIEDLRAAGATNVLAERHSVTRAWLNTASEAFQNLAMPDGHVHEQLSFIALTGWAAS